MPAFASRRRAPLAATALTLLACVAGSALPGFAAAAEQAVDAAAARALHQRILVLDSHVDVLLPDTPQRYADKDGKSQGELAKLVTGGVDAVVFAIAVGPGPRDAQGVAAARKEADAKLAAIRAFVADSNGKAVIATTADAIEANHAQGRISVIPGFLNARSLGKDVGAIDTFYAAGVRVFGLTHANHNDFADSSRPGDGPLEEHKGLSPLGRQAVAKLNDLGVIVDISQLTPAGVQQVLQLTRAPVIASHSAARALLDNTRSLSDAELDAIKKNGGVVHVPAFNSYLAQPVPGADAKVAEIRRKYGLPAELRAGQSANDGYGTLPADKQGAFNDEITTARGRASVKDLVDHVDYIARRIGYEHVGIGTDFNHGSGIVGFQSEADAPNVTRELLKRGYTEKQIAAIWSGNFLRVLRAVEKASTRRAAS